MQTDHGNIAPLAPTASVECLMPTMAVPTRLPLAKRSIDNFCRQTLANKSLLLVINGGTEEIGDELRAHVKSLGRDDIRSVTPPGGLNLGQLRNFSLQASKGDVLCQWDDDDLCHPQRLEKQLALLIDGNFEAVYLQEVMQYFPLTNTLYWTNWRATEAAALPGSLMVRRDVPITYPTEGNRARLGEDTEVALSLIARGRVGYLTGMPYLYVYVSHGANSWHDDHHLMLARELSISKALLRRRETKIREGLAPHGFSPNSITLQGNNGPAFIL